MKSHDSNSENKNQPLMTPDEFDTSIAFIVRFIKHAYKIIIIFGVLGFLIAIIYLAFAKEQYEAVAQIQMAQIGINNNNNNKNNNNNLTPLGVSIEEPALLISRLYIPTSYPKETQRLCGLDDKEEGGAILARRIKISTLRGVGGVVELKLKGSSREDVAQCANGIFNLIKTSQAQIMTPYIDEARTRLSDAYVRLDKVKDFVKKIDKSGARIDASYLLVRDEVAYLMDEIASLNNLVTSNGIRSARLVAPIYVSDSPVSPRKYVTLLIGLFVGVFLGGVFALTYQLLDRIKG